MRPHRTEQKAPVAAPASPPVKNGDGCASQQFVLRIGPSCVALQGQVDPGRWPLDAAHHRFVCPTAKPHLTVDVCHRPTGVPHGRLAFRVGGVAGFYRDEATWIIRMGEDGEATSADRALTLQPSGASGTLTMDVAQSPELATSYPLEYPLEDLLFRHLLADQHALIVHACGVAWQGQGFLFVGSSGAGKSTTAHLWKAAGATVLNDDRVVLEASQNEIRIHPTPWFGDYPEVGGEPVPLAALYLIRKGPQMAFQPIRPATAAALVLAKSFPPLWDRERMHRTLDLLDHACRQVPCGWLTAPADQRPVAWVQAQR